MLRKAPDRWGCLASAAFHVAACRLGFGVVVLPLISPIEAQFPCHFAFCPQFGQHFPRFLGSWQVFADVLTSWLAVGLPWMRIAIFGRMG